TLRYSDLAGAHKVGESDYSYDPVGRMTHLVHKDGSGTTLSETTYGYDLAGRLSAQTQDGATTSYSYDPAGQLLPAGSTAYSFRGTGNRTMTGYQTGADNRMTSDGVYSYTYDAEGNRVGKTTGSGSTAEVWTYTYDTLNRLTGVQETVGGTLAFQATFIYD